MRRVLLVLPSSTYRAAAFLQACEALDAEAIVGTDQSQAMAGSLPDRFVLLPLNRPTDAAEAIVELSRRRPLDAVIALDDQGIMAANMACDWLGLPHNPPKAVSVTRDKALMRASLTTAELLQPDFALVYSGGDPATVAADVGFPCVVKPISLSASRGVVRANDVEEAVAAVRWVRSILATECDPDQPVLVERYVEGPEVALEGLLQEGRLEVLAVFDKPDPLEGPYFEETIYTTPSRMTDREISALIGTSRDALAALGLVDGPVHVELRVNAEGPWLIELAARSIGGLCSRSLSFNGGASLEYLIVANALRLPLGRVRREDRASGVMMIPIPATGVLEEVQGIEDARGVPGVTGVEISIARGKLVRALPEGDRYLGFVFAKASTPDGVEAALRLAHSRLRVRIVRRD